MSHAPGTRIMHQVRRFRTCFAQARALLRPRQPCHARRPACAACRCWQPRPASVSPERQRGQPRRCT